MVPESEIKKPISNRDNYFQAIWIGVLLCLIVAAVSIPFLYPSTTLWYKTGIQRFFLLAGKISGLLAATLLFVQIAMIGLPIPFSRKTVVRAHRINGRAIGLLAVLHPLLVLGSDGFHVFDLQWKYWPEIMGIILFVVIGFNTVASLWRPLFQLSYQVWKVIHRFVALAGIALVLAHVLFVSDSFAKGPPRYGVLIVFTFVFIVWVLLIAGILPIKKRSMKAWFSSPGKIDILRR